MLKKIQAILGKISQGTSTFDPSVFRDSFAQEIDWRALKKGGTNFRTHKLIQSGYSRVEFKATAGAQMFSFIFIVAGAAASLFIGKDALDNGEGTLQFQFLMAVLFGVIFMGAGGFMFYSFSRPVVFDRTKGMYWKGWKAPQRYLSQKSVKESRRLGDIYALQIIPEFVRGDKSSYYSYELNLVLRDGSRTNVIDHGKAIKIREDAKVLSEFLGVPVWDAISTNGKE